MIKITEGMKCKQTKAIEEYGFDFVGEEFVITKVTNQVIMGKCYSHSIGLVFGIEPDKFEEYFELIQEKVEDEESNKIEKSNAKVYYYKALPYKVNWIISHNNENTYETVNSENSNSNLKLIVNDKATVVILDDGSKGVARCMPTDKYNLNKGFEIAYARAIIKSYEKKLKELTKQKLLQKNG